MLVPVFKGKGKIVTKHNAMKTHPELIKHHAMKYGKVEV
jgi:hypothetical protein